MSLARQYQKVSPVKKSTSPAKASSPKPTTLDIDLIRLDGGTQPRESIDGTVVGDYADAIREGAKFPPVTVFYDGQSHWLADGFHRHGAHKLAGKKKIAVELHRGTVRDAILYSVGVNDAHGLRRTNDDKRRAVLTLLNDAEWSKWSDREIARQCRVHHETVGKLRPVTGETASERTYKTKHGTVAKMDTSAIGKGNGLQENPLGGANAAAPNGRTMDDWMQADDMENGPLVFGYDLGEDALGPEMESEQTTDAPASQSKADRVAKQAENDALREQHVAALPYVIKQREQAKADAIAARKAAPVDARDQIAELERLNAELNDKVEEQAEAIKALESEVTALRAENKLYAEMKVQFAQGGFDKVVADKNEEIRVLLTRVAAESRDKAAWAKKAKYWQAEAKKLGWTNGDFTVDIETGEIANV